MSFQVLGCGSSNLPGLKISVLKIESGFEVIQDSSLTHLDSSSGDFKVSHSNINGKKVEFIESPIALGPSVQTRPATRTVHTSPRAQFAPRHAHSSHLATCTVRTSPRAQFAPHHVHSSHLTTCTVRTSPRAQFAPHHVHDLHLITCTVRTSPRAQFAPRASPLGCEEFPTS